MHTYEVIHHVGHSAQDMFNLVADVEKYPLYLPLCEELKITKRETREGKEVLIAKMVVGYKLIRESLTTEVVLDPENRQILVEYLDGPFSFLENRWRFVETDQKTCDIDFYIRYAFRSRMLEKLMGGLFAKAVERYTAAFEERADKVYGAPKFAPRPVA
ncbi:type II toxin-antitoxin system RatA family toxin [Methyloligella sp. 2.7D]|uniref:type II toxin-antitoxin system RatA family toxin n=1 Tax=unclassified Methyloligella TaxID=2625955 RepID=UPI00157C12BF|nr:type II toxin-antitoxin system RatA family toxin [Methyloligella sp. GL2]QKP77486.1 type II toxin-antitoxin system RatA family toxin [Methyloligella sp. GL2]